jgi:hypothetical protein
MDKKNDFEDDFEDDIEEELPSDKEFEESENWANNPNKIFSESGGVTASQSMGVDPSVDSLALEEYDHIEEVDKVERQGARGFF